MVTAGCATGVDGWLAATGTRTSAESVSNSAQSLPGKGFQTLAAGNDLGSTGTNQDTFKIEL